MTITLVDVETRDGWKYLTDTAEVIVERRPYQPRLLGVGGYARHQFEQGATLGAGGTEAKPIPAANEDRGLDGLHRAVDGRRIVVRQGEPLADGRAPTELSAYTVVFQGRIETIEFEGNTATLRVLSRQTAIAEALITDVRFDGTATSGGAGLGGNVELAGKPEPLLLGYAYNFAPPAANPFDGIYRVSRGWPGHSVAFEFVKDRGVSITPGVQHASLAALEGATPAAGKYDWYTGDDGTCIFPGTSASGVLTVAATEGGGRTIAEIAQWLLERSSEVDAGTILGVDVMNALAPGEAGIWIGPEDRTIGSALEEVLSGVGYWTDGLDDLTVTVAAWVAPEGAVQSIDEWETLGDVDLLSTGDVGGGAPIKDMIVGYRRNYEPLNKSALKDTLAESDASPLSEEWRLTTPAEAEGWADRNPLAQSMRVDTAFKNLADAERIRDRHRDLRANGIDMYRAPIATVRARAGIGKGVTLSNRRFGLSSALCGVLGRDTTGRTVEGVSVTDYILWRSTP